MSRHIFSLLSPDIANHFCAIASTVSDHAIIMALVDTPVHLNRTREGIYGTRSGLVQAWLHTPYRHPPDAFPKHWIVLGNAEKLVQWTLFSFSSKLEETCFPTEDNFSWLTVNHEREQYRIPVKLVPVSAVGFSQRRSCTKFTFNMWCIAHTQLGAIQEKMYV